VSALVRVQRRANPRVQVVLPVRLGVGDQAEAAVLSGETVDLSTGGCRVMTDRPWPTEADPVVTIDLPDGGEVCTQARVVTVDLNGDGWEYRLAFPGIAEPEAERLSRLVALGG
jgi:c-di-GMP-binding flagellar brake protein YcgR